MISNFRGSKSLWIYLAFFASPLTAWAQEPQVAKLYNQGVDAYFGGRTCQAEALLSEAIQWNSQDPRAYYFRAFSLLRQGHVAEARGDMLVGAMLEAQSPHRYAVGSALERIQGSDRLMLERFRCNARRNVVLQTSATEQLPPHARTPRPQTFNKSESSVLRENRIVPLEELLRPGGPRSIVEEPTSTSPPIPPQNSSPAAQPV